MALNSSGLNVAGNALKTAITHLSLHTANPGTTGTNPSAAARQPVTWTVTNGNLSASNISFTGGASSGPVTHVGYWSAVTGGTFYGADNLTGDTTFNSAGEYIVTSININASST